MFPHLNLIEIKFKLVKFFALMLLYQSDSSLFPSHSSHLPSQSSLSLNDPPLFKCLCKTDLSVKLAEALIQQST